MIFQFKDRFPQLNRFWDKYLKYQNRMEVPAKKVLLAEGKISQSYFFIEKGCVRLFFNNNGEDKTVQFFFENEGLTSFDSFINNVPSMFTIESIEPSVIYAMPKKHVMQLMDELSHEPGFIKTFIQMSGLRQTHYINEFVSAIRDTPEQRYQNLLKERPHIILRVPQNYIASYLGVTSVHMSRIKNKIATGKAHF
jgi:CRP-like cAMP-binding protein